MNAALSVSCDISLKIMFQLRVNARTEILGTVWGFGYFCTEENSVLTPPFSVN